MERLGSFFDPQVCGMAGAITGKAPNVKTSSLHEAMSWLRIAQSDEKGVLNQMSADVADASSEDQVKFRSITSSP